jgi:hypothetical protein
MLALALLASMACGATFEEPAANAPEEDETEQLFDPERVLEIEITLDPADWDLIRHQNRSLLDVLGTGCLDAPAESPFTYVSGTVTVDGTTLESVGIRKKGFLGSLDDEKPSLKLKFDEYVKNQELLGMDRLTLNNGKQDPSLIRPCLSYDLFRKAGVPASRCNFAHVTVNGQDLGIYANVETVRKRFLRRHFDDDEGALYEGALSDFREGWTGTFEKETNKDAPAGNEIAELSAALTSSDDGLFQAIEPLVDVDEFLSFWATEVLIAHADGYAGNTNNFFVYRDPSSGKFHFIPWGIDAVLGGTEGEQPLRSVYATGVLAHRLYKHPTTRARYVGRMRQLLAEVWDEQALLAEVDRMQALIAPYTGGSNDADVAIVRDFVRMQQSLVEAELDRGPPVWTLPLRDSICFEEIGSLSAIFSTTFGSLGAEDPFAEGTGTMSGSYNGVTIRPTYVGAVSGFDPETPNQEKAVVALVGLQPDGKVLIAYAVTPTRLFQPSAVLEVDWAETLVILLELDPKTNKDELIGIASGTLRFGEAGTAEGAIVTAEIDGPILRFPF